MLSPEQLALRRTGICATDVAPVLGLSPWRSPLDVFFEKTGRAPPTEETEDMQRGTFLEDGARRWYAHRTGAKVAVPGTLVHPRDALIIATPDGVSLLGGDVRGLEIKMPSSAYGWGDPGTDAIPQHYLVQCAWQLAAMAEWTDTVDVFAVLDGKPRLFHVRRDEEIEGELVDRMRRFWRDHVVTGKPPEVEPRDLESVSRAFRRSAGDDLRGWSELDDAQRSDVERWLGAAGKRKAAVLEEARWKAKVMMALGEAPGLRLPEGMGARRIDFRTQQGRAATDMKAIEAALGQEDATFRERVRELLSRHTKREPTRPLVAR